MSQLNINLRRTYRYSRDEDECQNSSEETGILDEEEQDNLIEKLNEANEKGNRFYTYAFVMFPLISTLPYIRTLFSPHAFIFSLISITSLLSTAYLLVTLPPGQTGIEFIDRLNKSSNPTQLLNPKAFQRLANDKGPINKFLPYLNLGLCASQILLGSMLVNKKLGNLWAGFSWLPIMNYGIVLFAAWIMGGVNPESELSGLRYRCLGA